MKLGSEAGVPEKSGGDLVQSKDLEVETGIGTKIPLLIREYRTHF